jgi:membrane protease YdiL (CAAX protease family)
MRLLRDIWTALRFGVVGLAVMTIIVLPWSVLAALNVHVSPRVPWAIPITLGYLGATLRYLSGHGPPEATRDARRHWLRARLPTPQGSVWAALSGVPAIAALWLVFASLGGFDHLVTPGRETTLPAASLVAFVIVSAAVTAIGEEAGLRGFMQAPLESRLGPAAAIAATATAFVLIHGSHGVPTLLHNGLFYAATGVVYGLLAYLTQSILPSLLLHFVGDVGVFALRSSLLGAPSLHTQPARILSLSAALIAAVVSVAAFRRCTVVTASSRFGQSPTAPANER